MNSVLISISFVFFFTNPAEASFLARFKNNPTMAMIETPKKIGAGQDPARLQAKIDACRRTPSIHSKLENQNLSTKNLKKNMRFFTLEASRESVQEFLENPEPVENIFVMNKTLRFGEVTNKPWSGDFWAFRSGSAAKRYMDPNFPRFTKWREAFDYYLANPPNTIEPKFLAPSEKYDLLVQDSQLNLTAANWQQGSIYSDETGDVETWMGICHGWAPASFMEPRPAHSASIESFGRKETIIDFLPDDIKALATLKWANGVNVSKNDLRPATRFIGGRCNSKDASLDPISNRILSPECFDLNPGIWHIVVTNHIGSERRPFIIDASFDYEVWNQPVTQYSYKYFNPKTMDEAGSLEEALVNMNDPQFEDKFADFRKNPAAVQLVGIEMAVTYTTETQPRGIVVDSPESDTENTVVYYYDLELDANGKILGGEWYQNSHPDFVWMPSRDSVALNREDLEVENEIDAIRIAPLASKGASPLDYVLRKLLIKAND